MMEYGVKVGDVVDGFVIEQELHVGGMAIAYTASHPDIGKPLIFKIPKIREGEDATIIVGFEMEMMILPRLSGPHVPRVYGVGDFARTPYIAMERIPGDTLFSRIEDAPLPHEEVLEIARSVVTGLADLHRQKVIHHDIKPSNIMFRETGEAVFIDFGLSRHSSLPDLLEAEFHLPMGTAPYISPEQVRHIRDEPRSDIFSFGVLMYHLITGERPFGIPRSQQALRTRIWRDPVPPRKMQPDIPPFMQEIILRCLEPDPSRRFPSAGRLAFNLHNPEAVRLTARAERKERDGLPTVFRRWVKSRALPPVEHHALPFAATGLIMVAVDLSEGFEYLAEALRLQTKRLTMSMTDVRVACINVIRLSGVFQTASFDEEGRNIHVQRLVELKNWGRTLDIEEDKLSYHVLESFSPAEAIIEFATTNHVDQILLCARGNSTYRRFLGSVSSEVVAKAPCTVTVVRAVALAKETGEDPTQIAT
ncbi:MAG: protein kinase [Hyphomicrobiales bacterium]|nr:protein kinase [Hyphomicrobiales bacterium]